MMENVGNENSATVRKLQMALKLRILKRRTIYTGVCWENLRERDQWGDPDVDGRIILR
jgi:hypothetical protein